MLRAARFGRLEISRLLIDHGADVNERNKEHWNPLYVSILGEHLDIVKLLLERGADMHAPSGEGITPYQLSSLAGNKAMADLFREHASCAARFEDIFL